MNAIRFFLILIFSISLLQSYAQCDVKSRVSANGALHYYIEPVRFYWTKSKQLDGGVITDKENYFLALLPKPFPPKPDGKKLKDELEVMLSNNQTYTLEHYDSRYVRNDTAFVMMFSIDKVLEDFKKYEIEWVKFNTGDDGMVTYNLKLHKAAVREQLACFTEEKK